MTTATVLYDSYGNYVEFYRETDAGSQTAIWGASRAECLEIAASGKEPKGLVWKPITGWTPDTSPGSAVWCESYGD